VTAFLLHLLACGDDVESAAKIETGTMDSDESGMETADSSDTEDTGESGDTGDTADTGLTGTSVAVELVAALKLTGPVGEPCHGGGPMPSTSASGPPIAGGVDLTGDSMLDFVVGFCGKNDYGGSASVFSSHQRGLISSNDFEAEVVGAGGSGSYESFGNSVAVHPNADGLGTPGLLIGAESFVVEYADVGAASLAYAPLAGSIDGRTGTIVLPGTDEASWSEQFGLHVGFLDDWNGDAVPDIVVDAPGLYDVYVLLGPVTESRDMYTAYELRLGLQLEGSISPVGDTDGDGLTDLLVGWYNYDDDHTEAKLYLGGQSGERTAEDADATFWDGELEWGSGAFLMRPGDLTGDGHEDLLLATERPSCTTAMGDYWDGSAHLLPCPCATQMAFPTTATASFLGSIPSGMAGISMSAFGDLTGDGISELAIAAPNAFSHIPDLFYGPGAVHILTSPYSGTMELGAAPLTLLGSDEDNLGTNLSGAGDVDDDGLPDLLMSGPGDEEGGEDAGAVWMVLGRDLPL
jgi:FG-GAP repeat